MSADMAAVQIPSKLFPYAIQYGRIELEIVPVIGIPRGRTGTVFAGVPLGSRFSIQIANEDLYDHECTEGDALVRDIVYKASQVAAPESDAERIRLFELIHDWLCHHRGEAIREESS